MKTQKPMPIDPERVQQVMRYAVAVAANADDFQRRELGPIHLLKYVYLADLAHAEKHDGQTYTGIPWRFHHFGPWAREASRQIPAAMAPDSIRHRSFQGDYQDDVSRWSSEEPELEETLEPTLPREVSRSVSLAVKNFGNDTSRLLHHVYRTSPMLKAAPEEQLDFSTVATELAWPEPEPPPKQLSKTARKRRQAAHDALRTRFQEALKKRRERRERTTAEPTHKGTDLLEVLEWVDSLAGEPIEPLEGKLIVSDDIWKSPARSGS